MMTEFALWEVQKKIIKHGYSIDHAKKMLDPISWYLNTCRASGTVEMRFRKFTPAQFSKVARIAEKYGGMDYENCVADFRNYVEKQEEKLKKMN